MRKYFRLCAVIAVVIISLFIAMGCGTDRDSSTGSSVGHERRGGMFDDMQWDQMGIDHNRGMAYVGSRFKLAWDTSWTREEEEWYGLDRVLDFIKDSTEYDSDTAGIVVQRFIDGEFNVSDGFVYLDSLKQAKTISSRERAYLSRLLTFVNYFVSQANPDSAAFVDSMTTYQNDILNVTWNSGETQCLALSSVAVYSWSFSSIGWGMGTPAPHAEGMLRLIVTDLVGGLFGGVPGAVAASALYMINDIMDILDP